MSKKYIQLLKRAVLVFSLVAVAIPFSSLINVLPASADASPYSKMTLEEQIAAYQFYQNLYVNNKCTTADTVDNDRIGNYDFFNEYGDTYFYVGTVAHSSSSGLGCGSPASMKLAGAAFGLSTSDPGELLCSLGYTQTNAASSATRTSCATGNTKGGSDSFHLDNSSTAIAKHLKSTVFGGTAPTWTNAMAYLSTFTDFVTVCKAQPAGSAYGAKVVTIKVVSDDGTVTTAPYTYTENDGPPFAAPGDLGQSSNSVETCADMGTALSVADKKYPTAYQLYVYQESCGGTYTDTTLINACAAGGVNKTNINYCPTTYTNADQKKACYAGQGNQGADLCIAAFGFTTTGNKLQACIAGSQNPQAGYCETAYANGYQGSTFTNRDDERAACLKGQTTPAAPGIVIKNNTVTPPGDTDKTSCGVEGIGWIVCPVISFMGDLLSNAFKGLADNFLSTDTSLFDTSSGTYTAWGIFRTFANVAFVIVFLIIIFSQLTGVGVTNYGVKKLLPRIVIAAILVNLSYFICQIAVDLSNILGYSLKTVFDGIAVQAHVPTSTDASGNGFGIIAIIGIVIATTAVAYFALSILIPIILGALVGVLMVILMLIARKAIIVLLIVLSPLAFVAFLLPNTESLFTKWRKAFMALLLLFPIISIVFGMASLASQIVLQAAGKSPDVTIQIMAVGIAALPFFIVPTLLKGSLNGIGTVGGKLMSFANKAGGSLGKAGSKGFANSRLGQLQAYRGAERSKRRSLIQSGAYSGRGGRLNPRNWASGANKAFNDSGVSGKFGDRNAAAGLSLAEKAEAEDVKAATMLMKTRATERGAEGMGYAKTELESALKSGDSIKARAAYSTLTSMGQAGVEQARVALAETTDSSGGRIIDKNAGLSNALKQHIINNHPEMKTSDNRQMGWATNDENATIDGSKHLNSLTDAQIASQTADSINAGAIDPTRARRILDDINISPNLKDSQRKALEAKAAGAPSTKPPTGPSDSGGSPPPSGFTPQDNGFLVPHK